MTNESVSEILAFSRRLERDGITHSERIDLASDLADTKFHSLPTPNFAVLSETPVFLPKFPNPVGTRPTLASTVILNFDSRHNSNVVLESLCKVYHERSDAQREPGLCVHEWRLFFVKRRGGKRRGYIGCFGFVICGAYLISWQV